MLYLLHMLIASAYQNNVSILFELIDIWVSVRRMK